MLLAQEAQGQQQAAGQQCGAPVELATLRMGLEELLRGFVVAQRGAQHHLAALLHGEARTKALRAASGEERPTVGSRAALEATRRPPKTGARQAKTLRRQEVKIKTPSLKVYEFDSKI